MWEICYDWLSFNLFKRRHILERLVDRWASASQLEALIHGMAVTTFAIMIRLGLDYGLFKPVNVFLCDSKSIRWEKWVDTKV